MQIWATVEFELIATRVKHTAMRQWGRYQTSDNFNSFSTNLEKHVANVSSSNPHFILMIGDFNAKSSNWSSNDTTTAEGAQSKIL